MSEEILKALMELFALIVKQDTGILLIEREYVYNFLTKQLSKETVNEYLALFDKYAGPLLRDSGERKHAAPTVKDSVKILGICKKINRTLNKQQKVVVLTRLFELVNADRQFTPQRMNIINTVAEVFKISREEFAAIEQYVKNDNPNNLSNPAILVLRPGDVECEICRKMHAGYQDMIIIILRIRSVDLYFIRYFSSDQLYLNGLPISERQIYTFAKGSSIKTLQGHPIYYSDISSRFLAEINIHKLSFTVENLTFSFKSGQKAVNNVNFSAGEGNLIGILGASGVGKSTLLNLISGIRKPTSGNVRINGIDIYSRNQEIEGVFGYVPQDDLLIEDLTVFENLYFAACQCFGKMSKAEIKKITDRTLMNLGLYDKRDLRVGAPLNNIISGGQRKRLNIALEVIREPSVLFLDEPTSGLSSRDSENLMDLLRDLTLKGKLIITVIHQPSSEIFKMFDKIIILDQGGYMIYSGNPVEAVIYFKKLDAQINSSVGECPSCGNVNPENIFNIIETQVVDEFGRYTDRRKVRPEEWAESFSNKHPFVQVPEIKEVPHRNLERPSLLRQFIIYITRDFKSKISNRQYLLLTLFEAPVLGFILSFITRYIPGPNSNTYIFYENENIPIYIFMSLIVALFLGLTVSAEEIFRDRKILKREHFLSLSRFSYLFSKVGILLCISVIQVFLFLITANPILGIKDLFPEYFIALFTTAFCANMIGLNISASFNSAITIYIVIPLIIIPMMLLSGAMFPFDKLNRKIGSVDKVPVIAELMPTRWTYEALMVSQFKDNMYSRFNGSQSGENIYEIQKKWSIANYYSVKLIPGLITELENTHSIYQRSKSAGDNPGRTSSAVLTVNIGNLKLIKNELNNISAKFKILKFKDINELTPEKYNNIIYGSLLKYLNNIGYNFDRKVNEIDKKWNDLLLANESEINQLRNNYHNLKLQEIMTKLYERDKNKMVEYNDAFIQNYDPIYLDPDDRGLLAFRTHFFAPCKYFFGYKTDTFIFNISLVLFSIVVLFIMLYYDLLLNVIRVVENLRFRK